MSHQCLQCGKVFKQGSTELLKGCSECGGTRFFFTNNPLDKDERAEMMQKANNDLRNVVAQMIQNKGSRADYEGDAWSEERRREWVSLKPKDLKKVVRELAEKQKDAGKVKIKIEAKKPVKESASASVVEDTASKQETASKTPGVSKQHESAPTRHAAPASTLDDLGINEESEIRPETVSISEPGSYELDVKKLLESEPIIIQKNGMYLIHLPSVFEEINKKSNKN